MGKLEELNAGFGILGELRFVSGPGGMPVIELDNGLGAARIALQGAHVLGFQATGQQPLIWMSDEAMYAPGKSLRGGVPVCWPWFGPHASDSTLPGHGPARTVDWQPVASGHLQDGRTSVSLEFVDTEATRRMIDHPLRVQLHVVVGSSLSLTLETSNMGSTPFTLGEALHTYFLVGDVQQAQVEGLDGCSYIDKVHGGAQGQQHGPLGISEETDRIYLGSGKHCTIRDPSMHRCIVIDSAGSDSVVVWNPWQEKAEAMGDLGPDGYRNMLCVETANAATDVVQLAAGATHRLVAEYSSKPL